MYSPIIKFGDLLSLKEVHCPSKKTLLPTSQGLITILKQVPDLPSVCPNDPDDLLWARILWKDIRDTIKVKAIKPI